MRPANQLASVVVIPNCLRGCASASEVAEALASGVRRCQPVASVVVLPLADGGDGTLDVLAAVDGGHTVSTAATDAFDAPLQARWLDSGATAAIEAAAICGLGDRTAADARPLRASSAGLGRVLAAVTERGIRSVRVGLGGTSVVDGGAGALAALGAVFVDHSGQPLDPVRPENLLQAVRVDLAPAQRRLRQVEIILLADVEVPLAANIEHFGAQKGVTDQNRPVLTAALHHLVDLLAEAGPEGGAAELRARFQRPWFGAGGGIGLGLSAVVATRAESGAAALLDLADRERTVSGAALAITAEGWVDGTTWLGKLPGVVVQRRAAKGLHTALVAGGFSGAEPRPFTSHHLITSAASAATPLRGPTLHAALSAAAEQACRTDRIEILT